MTEYRREVRVFEVEMECEACCSGFMRPTGIARMSSPPKYDHKCTSCGALRVYKETYPKIEYEPIGEFVCI